MPDYIFEVGIDRHAKPDPNGIYPLFFNICTSVDLPTPVWTTQFRPEETFRWHFFDYTDAPNHSQDESLSIEGFTMSIVKANDRNILIPILPERPLCFGSSKLIPSLDPNQDPSLPLGVIVPATIGSLVFGNISGGWNLPSNTIDQAVAFAFPAPPDNKPLKAILRFGLTVTVTKQSSSGEPEVELRHYGHDPEIIVGPGT